MLEVKDLVVKYGEITALSGINIQAEEGQLTTLIGSNGAGKTTLLKALSGLHKPASGKIIFDGNDITESSTDKIVTLGISHCPEGRRVFPRQSVIENLRMGAFIRKDKEIEEDIKKYFQWFPRLEERKNQKAGLLSGGEQQMLAISRALMSRPKLLLLDEPSMGLAPLVVEEVFKIIDEVHRQGTTIFLVEQNARQALKIADKGYVLEVGKITASDSAENLLNSEDVKKAYLGA
ncbi:ABC transporter ATP-binding protein [bacterium 1XD8-76]|nr:ABC transporter ATP-binding protein [bacterium 1XD8-76]